MTHWFNILGRHLYVSARLLRSPENHGWGNRFNLRIHHHPSSYTAGFNNPSLGVSVELRGWQLGLGMEY